MNWCRFISGFDDVRSLQPGTKVKVTFFPPASVKDLVELESQLQVMLPSSLRSLLLETNGVMEMLSIDGGEWFEDMWLFWPAEEIIKVNQFFRAEKRKGTYQRAFDELLFFAGAGCDGILFAHPIREDRVSRLQVVVWHPFMDELTEIAFSLKEFVEGWLTGSISV